MALADETPNPKSKIEDHIGPQAADQTVPLALLLEERRERQRLESDVAELRRQVQGLIAANEQSTSARAAFSIDVFCQENDTCRSKAYEEINAGRLRILKVGRRTLITPESAEAWRRLMEADRLGPPPKCTRPRQRAGADA